MKQIELSAGTIEYQDTGQGPTLVLLHGLMMDASPCARQAIPERRLP